MNANGLSRRAALMTIGASALCAGRASAQSSQRCTIITSPSDSGGEVYYAQELGIFKKHGLQPELVSLNAGSAVAAAIASGLYDVGQSNVVTVAAAREKGLPFVLIAAASIFNATAPTTALVVAKDSPIKSAADLVGKPVGNTSLRDIGTLGIDVWLTAQGVTPSSVRIVEMPGAQMSEALARGTVVAAHIIEPFLSAALAAGNRILAVPYTAIGPRFMIAAYFATTDWVKAEPAKARNFRAALTETARWANKNHTLSGQILEKYTKIVVSPTQTRTEYAETLDPRLIQPLLDAGVKDGFLKQPVTAQALSAG
jgi:NitT/TauT family transport system substrate-binding protein